MMKTNKTSKTGQRLIAVLLIAVFACGCGAGEQGAAPGAEQESAEASTAADTGTAAGLSETAPLQEAPENTAVQEASEETSEQADVQETEVQEAEQETVLVKSVSTATWEGNTYQDGNLVLTESTAVMHSDYVYNNDGQMVSCVMTIPENPEDMFWIPGVHNKWEGAGTVTFEYDEEGRKIRRTNTYERIDRVDIETYDYDAEGRLSVVSVYTNIDAYGDIADTEILVYRIAHTYDNEGRLIGRNRYDEDESMTMGLWFGVSSYEYDAEGRLLKAIGEYDVMEYTYDAEGVLTSTWEVSTSPMDPMVYEGLTEYDSHGNPVRYTLTTKMDNNPEWKDMHTTVIVENEYALLADVIG